MAMALQVTTFVHQFLNSQPRKVERVEKPIRMGVLSTAMINPAALIHPVEIHPEVVLYGVASRNYNSARDYARKHGFERAYGTYQDLLLDPDIDAVYISLPNGMHYEWAKKSLEAAKHVLLKKPLTSNADEARDLCKLAKKKGLVLEEAFHWMFHPAAHVVKSIILSRKYGKIVSTHSSMTIPAGSIPKTDIRWQYDLAGGALMDMTYVLSSTRYFLDAGKPLEVVSATARPWSGDKRVDEAMNAELIFASDRGVDGKVKSTIYADMARKNTAGVIPRVWEAPSIKIEFEKADLYFYNFIMPHLYHLLKSLRNPTGTRRTRSITILGPSEPYWSTYRYQLEAFVDGIKNREPAHWISLENSIEQMETIDAVYERSGLGARKGTGELLNGV